jgi:hypothetical protein
MKNQSNIDKRHAGRSSPLQFIKNKSLLIDNQYVRKQESSHPLEKNYPVVTNSSPGWKIFPIPGSCSSTPDHSSANSDHVHPRQIIVQPLFLNVITVISGQMPSRPENARKPNPRLTYK